MTDKKTILIVDDEQDFVKTTSLRLRFEGYDTVEANDGLAALERVKERKPDLILLDIMMPGMSGVEVFERLRSNEDTNSIPIIFLTVWERLLPGGNEGEGLRRHLIKPFDFHKLIQTVKDMLGEA